MKKWNWMIPAAMLLLGLCACAPKTPNTELKDAVPPTIEVPDIEVDYESLSSAFPAPTPKEAQPLAEQAVEIATVLYPDSHEGYTGHYIASYGGTQTTEDGTFYYFHLYDSYEEPEGSAEYAVLCTIAVQAAEGENEQPRYFLYQSDGYLELLYDGETVELTENTGDTQAEGSAG